RDAVGVRDLLDGRVLGAEVAGPADAAQRAPGQERDPQVRRVPQFGFAGPEGGRELVLDAGQVALTQDPPGSVDLVDGRVGDAGQPDLARVEQVLQRADRLLVGA